MTAIGDTEAFQRVVARETAAPPIFVGGCPRSGTTLLRVILDSHPEIVCGPELRAFPALASLSSETRSILGDVLAAHYRISSERLDCVFRNLVASFLDPLRAKSGKRRVAEKTPANALYFGELARLFPKAAFVQIIRDGRDAVASLLTMDWRDARTGAPLRVTTDAGSAAWTWANHVRRGREAAQAGADYFELRYEDLVRDPRAALRPLFAFLGEDWSDAVLDFAGNPSIGFGVNEASAAQVARGLASGSIGRWRRDLSEVDKKAFKTPAGELLIELGYADDDRW